MTTDRLHIAMPHLRRLAELAAVNPASPSAKAAAADLIAGAAGVLHVVHRDLDALADADRATRTQRRALAALTTVIDLTERIAAGAGTLDDADALTVATNDLAAAMAGGDARQRRTDTVDAATGRRLTVDDRVGIILKQLANDWARLRPSLMQQDKKAMGEAWQTFGPKPLARRIGCSRQAVAVTSTYRREIAPYLRGQVDGADAELIQRLLAKEAAAA